MARSDRMLLWLALLGMLVCLAAIAIRNAGLSDRLPAWLRARGDLGLIGLALLALVFALRPTLASAMVALPLLAAIAAWGRAFGLRSACFAWLIVACSIVAGFGSREPDPLAGLPVAAVIAGVAALEGRRFAIAGALLGYATIAAAWPGLFALACMAKLTLDSRRALLHALAGFVGVALVSLVLPEHAAAASFGLGESDPAGPRAVGLRWLFALDGNLDPGKRWLDYPAKLERLRERSDWLWACATLLTIPVLVAIRRLDPARFVAIAGCTSLLAFASVDAGAWLVACVLLAGRGPLLGDRPLTLVCAALLAIDLALAALARVHGPPFSFNVGMSSLLTLLVLGLGVALLLDPDLREAE